MEWLLTLFAHKAVGVPLKMQCCHILSLDTLSYLLVERGDIIVHDGRAAASTLGGKLTNVAILAVGSVLSLMEPIITQLWTNQNTVSIAINQSEHSIVTCLSQEEQRKCSGCQVWSRAEMHLSVIGQLLECCLLIG